MMTPNDVAQHRFTTHRFGGYNTNDVDEFLDDLTADYTALYKENAVLKGKMKVLVDKIAEYRATEDDMRVQLLNARKSAESIIAQAEENRDAMMKEALSEAKARKEQLDREIEDAHAQLDAARQTTLDFAAAMRGLAGQQQGMLDQQISFLDRLDEIKAEEKPQPQEEESVEAVQEEAPEEDELTRRMEEAAAQAEASPESAYQSFDEGALNAVLSNQRVDEPTRVMDLSEAQADQEYKV